MTGSRRDIESKLFEYTGRGAIVTREHYGTICIWSSPELSSDETRLVALRVVPAGVCWISRDPAKLLEDFTKQSKAALRAVEIARTWRRRAYLASFLFLVSSAIQFILRAVQ